MSPSPQRAGRRPSVALAPEVAALILADRVAGVPTSVTSPRLRLTPRDVLAVLRAERLTPDVASPVLAPRPVAERMLLPAIPDANGRAVR
jgi:hypothetical protein